MMSIVIPTLNEEKYIERTLKSVKGQRYRGRYEIIIADGFSTDDTLKIARKYTRRIVKERKRGIAAGRNAGAQKSKGDILLFIDADTKLMPGTLDKIAARFKDKDIVAVTPTILPEKKTLINILSYWAYNAYTRLSTALGKPLIGGMCVAYRRKTFEKVGGFDERLMSGEDLDISLKIGEFGKCVVLDDTHVITSTRRLDAWGPLGFSYQYLKTFLLGKMEKGGEYKPVR